MDEPNEMGEGGVGPSQSVVLPDKVQTGASSFQQQTHPATRDGLQILTDAGAAQQEGQSEDEDDEDDMDFNPLFLKEDTEEEEESEEEGQGPEEARVSTPPPALHALLEPGVPGFASAASLPLFNSPGGQPPAQTFGPLSPGLSSLHLLGPPLSFSPAKAGVPHNDGGAFPQFVGAPPNGQLPAANESPEPADGPAKRTRAQVSLAELTLEELETFLKDDEDDFFPDIDDDEEYSRFLASISTLEDLPGEKENEGKAHEDDEDEDDVDFVADDEAEEEEEEDAQAPMGRRKVGRPRGSFKKKPPPSDTRLQRVAAAARRPLAIKPSSLGGRYTQVVCHVPSKDGRPRPLLMLKPVEVAPPPATVPRFTASQVGQLYCQVHEHVQLLLQLYSVTCLGPPLGRALAEQCKAHLEALAGIREKILQTKKTAFPDRCFRAPCARPSLQLETIEDGRLKVAQWAPLVKGPVRSLLDVKPLERAGPFLEDMALVITEMDRKLPPESGETLPKNQLKPLFPPNPDARPINKPSQTIRSILTNQHNPSPLTRGAFDAPITRGAFDSPIALGALDSALIVQYPAVESHNAQSPVKPAPTFHSALLADSETVQTPVRPLPLRPLFLNEQALVNPQDEETSQSKEIVPRGSDSVESNIQADLQKAAKPSMVPMALVAPIVSDLVREKFEDCFNPALFPKEPQANTKPRLFTEAEDELLALGIQECHLDWERIQQRFLPTKTPHQIAVRVKNRCSAAAPDNPIKQARCRKTAPLTAQEKFVLDEGIRQRGHDWIHLATYVPRADPRLLPKLYKDACGIKPKNWKKNQERNAWRRKQRQLAAEQAAKREAAAELRELDEEASQPKKDTTKADGAEAAVPEVRGLFLAGEEAPTKGAPTVVQQQGNGNVRPFSATDMAAQQPPPKRRKGGPPPSLLPNSSGIRPLVSNQGPPQPRPVMLYPSISQISNQASMPVAPPVVRPPPNPQVQNGPLRKIAPRVVVIRPQARRATPVAGAPIQQLVPTRSLGATNGHQADALVAPQQTTVRPQPSQSKGPQQSLPKPAAGPSSQIQAVPVEATRPLKAARPSEKAPSGVLLEAVQKASQKESAVRSSVQIDRPAEVQRETNVRSIDAGIQKASGSLVRKESATAVTGPLQLPTVDSKLPNPASNGRLEGAMQTSNAGTSSVGKETGEAAKTTATEKATGVPEKEPPVTPAAPVHTASVDPGVKPWKTRQRQPKALKMQQKAKEEEEKKRKKELKEAERQKGKKAKSGGEASEKEGGEGGSEPQTKRPPPAKRVRGRKGSSKPPKAVYISGGSAWRPVVPRVIPQGGGAGVVSGLDYAPHLFPSARLAGTQQAHPAQGPAAPPLQGDQRGFQPVPRGSFPRPQMESSNGLITAAGAATWHPRGRGSEQAGASSGEAPMMEREELPDSDGDDEKWEHDDILDPEDEPHPTAHNASETVSLVASTTQLAPLEEGLESRESGQADRVPPEMERDELTDSEDEERRAAHNSGGPSERAIEMDRDELSDSEEDDQSAAQGEGEKDDMIRGFLMEQDELTESDDEETRGGGSAQKSAERVDAAWDRIAEPTESHVLERDGSRPALGVAERSVLFEKDELGDSEDDGGGRGAHNGFEQDEVTESDDDG